MSQGDERLEFDDVLPRIAELAEALTAHPDQATAATAEELLDWIDVFHANGVGRLVEMIREWRGDILLESVAADPVAGALLEAYGLGVGADAESARVAVQAALNEVRPYLHSHGGDMEVVDIADGVVRLKMHGSCDGCTGAEATIVDRVERALQAQWVDFRRVDVEAMEGEPHPPPAGGTITTGLQITGSQDKAKDGD